MKCRTCGYFSLPGASVCGQCGADLLAVETVSPAAQDLYPPRARDRPWGTRLREPLRRRTGRLRRAFDHARTGMHRSSWIGLLPSLSIILAVVPGLGHLLQGRIRAGARLMAAAAFLYGVLLLAIRHPASDLLLWCLLGLAVFSVWDAAEPAFPGGSDAGWLRAARRACLSVGVVAGSLVGAFAALSPWYGFWVINGDQAGPFLRRGDGLIVRRFHGPGIPMARGDVIVLRGWITDPGRTERVLGLPGDRVEGNGRDLFVNGRPVPPDHLPLTHTGGITPFRTVVGPGEVCILRPTNAPTVAPEGEDFAPYELLPARSIDGRAVAIYQPARRRRWL